MDEIPQSGAKRRPYHHGDLRNALITAAIELVQEVGVENVSVREAAKRVGVSPGAPFRHFASRTDLLTAVAQEAQAKLIRSIDIALERARDADALDRFQAIGEGFLRWAFESRPYFLVISNRALIDFEGSALRANNDMLRARMSTLLTQAREEGLLHSQAIEDVAVMSRALVYGLVRMYVDGQMPSWGIDPAQGLDVALRLLREHIRSLRISRL